jgi:hypothetical protein
LLDERPRVVKAVTNVTTMTSFTIWYARMPLAVVLTAALGTATIQAQATHDDLQIWPSIAVVVPLGERVEVRADALLQTTTDLSRVGRQLARVIVGRSLNDRLTVGAGYTWTRVKNATGSHSVEHRAVQEVALRVPVGLTAVVFSSRTRFEQRRRSLQPETAVRLRQLTRLDVLLDHRGLRAVGWNEYFASLNRTDWSGRAGPGLMLNFAGIHVPVTRKIAVETGYLNQTIFVAGRNNVDHVVAMFFTARL